MPTRLGWTTLIGGVLLLAAGYGFGFVQLVVVGLGAVLAVGIATGATRPRPSLVASREILPLRVARGDAAVAALTVTAEGRHTPRLAAAEACGTEPVPVELPALQAGETRVVTYRLPTRRRGVVRVGPLAVNRADPFGLAGRRQVFGDTATLWVHPRTVDLGPPASGRTVSLDGLRASDASDGTVTFSRLRQYVPGDDPRRIHWRTSARTGTLTVRQLVDTSLPTTTVVLDDRVSVYPDADAFEEAIDAAASILASATGRKQPALLRTPAGAGYHGSGAASDLRQLLDRLSAVALGEAPISAGFDALPQTRRGSSLVLVTGAASATDVSAGLRIRRRYSRMVVARFGDPQRMPVLDPGQFDLLDCRDLDEFARAWRVLDR